jgi:CelD/BcsL family acetyltransferase involved in cellulose biosynthesis
VNYAEMGSPSSGRLTSQATDTPVGEVSPATGGHGLTVRVEQSFVGLEALCREWDETVSQLGGSVYMSYDWTRTWWEFYGTNRELRIFLFSVHGRIVGIVPLYIDRMGFGPLQLSVARLVCANIPPKAFNPPIHADWAEPIFEVILTQLFERDACDVFSFGPLSEEHEPKKGLEQVARRQIRQVSQVSVVASGVSSVFRLPRSLEEYFECLDKDERKKRKYELRLLRREQAVTEDVLRDPAGTEAGFEDFVRLHAQQWQGKGKLGHFGSWPRAEEFNRALVRALGKLGRVRFVRLLANNRVISSQYAFAFGDAYFWELPARVMAPEWRRFSLGTAGFFSLVDAAIKEGKTRVEGGLAHYDYKQKLNATEQGTWVVRVVGRGLGCRVRLQLFLFLRFCLLWLYYKIWYARICPRLPALLRRPIWSWWLRLDF